MNPDLSTLPTGILVVIAVVAAIEITLDVIALVSLYRRPLSQVALGNKWVWVAIILLVNLVGPVLYFVIGRKTDVPEEQPARSRASATTTDSIADSLYGRRDDSGAP
jgi:hypothetical protein